MAGVERELVPEESSASESSASESSVPGESNPSESSVPGESNPSESASPAGEVEMAEAPLRWTRSPLVDDPAGSTDTTSEPLDRRVDDDLPLDLAGPDHPAANGAQASSASAPEASDRAAQLANDHWRERAVLWRERAMAAELVVKLLQRNLDDLRANLEDLRREAQTAAALTEILGPAPGQEPAVSPWRRFARDLYAKYVR